jgi:ketosteroid isomerase-like protein
VTYEDEIRAAAEERASALAARDHDRLASLLHPRFSWTSHRGEVFDRAGYLRSNTAGTNQWHDQRLEQVDVVVVGEVGVLRCVVTDEVDVGSGRQSFRMPMTQVWVRESDRWVCLSGHAGPRLDH